jgi:branched-chain amino acid aminotransferase
MIPGPSGFGLHPSSALFVRRWRRDAGWDEGRWMAPELSLTLPPQMLALGYGISAFEGLKAYRTVQGDAMLFRAELHAARFADSAAAVLLPRIDVTDFLTVCREVVVRNADHLPEPDRGALYVRPMLFADEARLGLGVPKSARLIVFASPVTPYFATAGQGVRLRVAHRVRVPAGGIGAAKVAANYAGTLAAVAAARAAGYHDVVFCDARRPDCLSEATGANLFARGPGGTVVTPPLSDQILAGVTRASVIALLRDWQIPVEERPLNLEEAGRAEEFFCTGTAWGVVPAAELDGGPGGVVWLRGRDLSARLGQALDDIHAGRRADPFGSLRIALPH